MKRFRPEYFSIKEWRGDKYVDGVYAESSENPDLEIEFRLRGISTTLAVECKWRQSFERRDKVGLTWASSRQIANYQRFADARGLPVFVVIGVGGQPSSPAELYVIPLTKLRYPWANAEYLSKYRRASVGVDFYYDYNKNELR